ncbi:MAG: carboxypeptidase regulatory-like domain-containing protein [Gemmatimonadota bacterium]
MNVTDGSLRSEGIGRRVLAWRGVVGLAPLGVVALAISLPAGAGHRVPGVAGPSMRGSGGAGGTITGVVRFQGEYPTPEKIEVTQDASVCGTTKLSNTFVISPENKGLKNVLVTVEGVTGGKAPTPTPRATITQKGCSYEPHFQVVELGPQPTELLIRNEDGILHNINVSMGGRTLFNSAQPAILKELKKKLRRPGVAAVKCDVHGWMNAYIVVLKGQPYYSVSDDTGAFAIHGVPPGTYTLRAWHEALGEMTRSVTVAEGKTVKVDFVITPKRRS